MKLHAIKIQKTLELEIEHMFYYLWMKLLVIIAFVYRLRIFTWQILKAWRSALANNQTTHIEKERVYIQAMYQNTALFKYHDFKVFLLQTWNETFPSTHEKSIKEV